MYNLPISNVPGPRDRGSIAGAPLSEPYSVGPLTAGSGMNITVWSYVDQIAISVIADDRNLHDPHEATDAMLRAFAEIRSTAVFPPCSPKSRPCRDPPTAPSPLSVPARPGQDKRVSQNWLSAHLQP